MNARRTTLIGALAVAVLLALAPVYLPLVHLDISIVSEVLIFAIAAMSVNLLLGYTGLPAFGNAAFFGLGAYGAGLSIKYFHVHFIEATLIGTLAGLVGGVLLGPFLLRRRGIYFGLLAIAFGQVFYFIAYRFTNVTGGEDGMNFTRPYVGLPSFHVSLRESAFFYAMLVIYLGMVAAFWVIADSPFGRTLVAIRQNEVRVRYLGLNTDRFIFVALLIAATVAGLSGALFGLLINFAYPLLLDWHQSGDFVLIMILGGAGTLFGPLVGATIFVIGKDVISTITPLWQIFLGGLFIACVLGFPKGILGTIAALRQRAPVEEDLENATAEAHAPYVGGTS
ncbi:MAG: branched-chain amino acid ABC transporter permease [Candidatus Velthaea sp.]